MDFCLALILYTRYSYFKCAAIKEVVTDAKAGAATTKFYGENGEIIKTETKNLR